ncbi:hypothetical protein ACTA71_011190 [Dictyostelium dimigraforme]
MKKVYYAWLDPQINVKKNMLNFKMKIEFHTIQQDFNYFIVDHYHQQRIIKGRCWNAHLEKEKNYLFFIKTTTTTTTTTNNNQQQQPTTTNNNNQQSIRQHFVDYNNISNGNSTCNSKSNSRDIYNEKQ